MPVRSTSGFAETGILAYFETEEHAGFEIRVSRSPWMAQAREECTLFACEESVKDLRRR